MVALVEAPVAVVTRRRELPSPSSRRVATTRRRRHLNVSRQVGLWLVRENGVWSSAEHLTQARAAGAEMVVGGGHRDRVETSVALEIVTQLGSVVDRPSGLPDGVFAASSYGV